MKRRIPVIVAMVVVVGLLVFVPSHRAQTSKKMNLNVVYTQENAPVEIVSSTSDLDYFFSKAEVKNVSASQISSLTVGVFVHESQGGGEPILVNKHQIQTDIKPGATRLMDTFGVSIKQARQTALEMKTGPVALDCGVLEVGFEDGGSWSSTATENKAFPSQVSSLMSLPSKRSAGTVTCNRSSISAWLGSLVPTVFAQSGYHCVGTQAHEICTVAPDGTSCSNHICTRGQIESGACSNQTCAINE